jgi:hypothetical protein
MSLAFIVSQIVYNESRFFTELLTISHGNTRVAHFLYIAYFSPKVKLRFPPGEKHGLQRLTALHRRKRLVGFIEPEPVRDHSAEQLPLLFNQVERLESVACTADPDALDFYVLFDDLLEKIDSTVAGRLGKTYRQVCPARPQQGKALMDRGWVPCGLDHHIYAPTSGPAEDKFPPFFDARRAPVEESGCSERRAELQTIL